MISYIKLNPQEISFYKIEDTLLSRAFKETDFVGKNDFPFVDGDLVKFFHPTYGETIGHVRNIKNHPLAIQVFCGKSTTAGTYLVKRENNA